MFRVTYEFDSEIKKSSRVGADSHAVPMSRQEPHVGGDGLQGPGPRGRGPVVSREQTWAAVPPAHTWVDMHPAQALACLGVSLTSVP